MLFFLEAMHKVCAFKNITHAELIFSAQCCAEDEFWDGTPETCAFRMKILSAFYAGVAQAGKISSVSIQNLQNVTPRALKEVDISRVDEPFKRDFKIVMSRIKQLSLSIAVESFVDGPAEVVFTDAIHNFLGSELQQYWLGPIAANLEYLKLYGSKEVYWGFFPVCNLPHFPKIKTLILGGVSFTSERQVQWILSHASTLQELILDNATIGVAVEIEEFEVDVASRTVLYERNQPSQWHGYLPVSRHHLLRPEGWLDATRWHHLFRRFREELPGLRHFVINHSHWDDHAFEHADALSTALKEERYTFFKEFYWKSFSNSESGNVVFREQEEDEKDRLHIERPDCNEEDQQALNELLEELKKRT